MDIVWDGSLDMTDAWYKPLWFIVHRLSTILSCLELSQTVRKNSINIVGFELNCGKSHALEDMIDLHSVLDMSLFFMKKNVLLH